MSWGERGELGGVLERFGRNCKDGEKWMIFRLIHP